MSASRNNRKKFDHDRHSPAYGRDRGAGPIRTRRRGLIVAAVSVAMVVAGLSVGIEASGALSGSASPTTSTGATGTGTSTTADPTLSTIPSGPSQTQAPGLRTPGGASPGKGAFNDVACPDATKCLAVGADATGVGVVSSSGDGGSSWSNVAVPPSTSTLNAIACGDASDCVAAGEGTLLATHDGGTTWSRTVPPTADTTLLGVACTGAKVCLASGVSPNPGGPYWGQLLRSVDAGSTWTPISLPMGTLGIGGVTCPTSSLCIAVGAGIYVSADGGATWQERTVANGTGALRSISCSTALHCVAIGPNPAGLYHPDAPAIAVSTNDGGQTWQQLAFPAKTGSLEQIACSGPSTCFAGGASPGEAQAPPSLRPATGERRGRQPVPPVAPLRCRDSRVPSPVTAWWWVIRDPKPSLPRPPMLPAGSSPRWRRHEHR